jgi:hypothetical protein
VEVDGETSVRIGNLESLRGTCSSTPISVSFSLTKNQVLVFTYETETSVMSKMKSTSTEMTRPFLVMPSSQKVIS